MQIIGSFVKFLQFVVLGNGLCPDPVCRDQWDASSFPNPKTDSGLCGRGCKDSYVCDPCQILNSQGGEFFI